VTDNGFLLQNHIVIFVLNSKFKFGKNLKNEIDNLLENNCRSFHGYEGDYLRLAFFRKTIPIRY